MDCWTLNVGANPLSEVLSWSLTTAKANRMLFAMRLFEGKGKKRFPPDGVERNVQQRLGKFVIASFWASGWPGTELVGHKGRVFITSLDEEVKDLIVRTQSEWTKWHNDASFPLPEDLCFFKEGSQYPALVSITHEKQAWLISDARPQLTGVRKSRIAPADLIFSGRYFCKE